MQGDILQASTQNGNDLQWDIINVTARRYALVATLHYTGESAPHA